MKGVSEVCLPSQQVVIIFERIYGTIIHACHPYPPTRHTLSHVIWRNFLKFLKPLLPIFIFFPGHLDKHTAVYLVLYSTLAELHADLFSRHASLLEVCILWRSTKEVTMTRIILCFSLWYWSGSIHQAGCYSDAGPGLLLSSGVWL